MNPEYIVCNTNKPLITKLVFLAMVKKKAIDISLDENQTIYETTLKQLLNILRKRI